MVLINQIQVTMKKVVLFISLIISFMTSAQSTEQNVPEDYDYIVKIGQTVPDFSLTLPNGETTTMKALRGKVVMLQFTASWCSVCRKEMPHIEKDIWLKHKDNSKFALYGIDLKESAEKTQEFQTKMEITYPLALDLDGSIFDLFVKENAGVTRNIIVDKDGKIVFLTRLFKQKEFDEMKVVIDSLLK